MFADMNIADPFFSIDTRLRVALVAPISTFAQYYSVIVSEKRVFLLGLDKTVPTSYFRKWDIGKIREYIDKKYIWTYTKKTSQWITLNLYKIKNTQ